ncbi:MAG: methionyl-tRNA formyltransferase [Patescibacteria group bacterium]|jgi:methionyl-tRNA formyltransferase
MKTSTRKYRVIFMGTPEFAKTILQTLLDLPQLDIVAVITQPDKPIGRHKTVQPSPVKQLALANRLTVWTPEKLKHNSEILEKIKALDPDVIIVAAYGKILPQEILDIPAHGIVNIHGSLLPKYRGASPIAAAILNGDTITGVTLMKIDATMDTGPIIAVSEPVPIKDTSTQLALSHVLAKVGADLLQQNLIPYLEGEIAPISQDDSQATYTSLIKKEDGLINWQEPAFIIERKTRAYTPQPTTYTFYHGKRLKIAFSKVVPTDQPRPVGQAWLTSDKHLAVSTSQASLQLEVVCLEGKNLTSDQEFLRGHPDIIGTILG